MFFCTEVYIWVVVSDCKIQVLHVNEYIFFQSDFYLIKWDAANSVL